MLLYKDITFEQFCVLHYFNKVKSMTGENIIKRYPESVRNRSVSYLLNQNYITKQRTESAVHPNEYGEMEYKINPNGENTYMNCKSSLIQVLIPYVFSFGALIVSIIALCRT